MIDPDLLLQGYRLGVFPMAMNDDSIEWFSPDPRAVLPLEDFQSSALPTELPSQMRFFTRSCGLLTMQTLRLRANGLKRSFAAS